MNRGIPRRVKATAALQGGPEDDRRVVRPSRWRAGLAWLSGAEIPRSGWANLVLALLVFSASFLLEAPRAAADGPPEALVTVEARTDRGGITIGDRVRLTVVVHAAPGITLEPSSDEESFGRFEVLERHPGTVQRAPDGSQVLRLEYVITAFEPGSVVVPGLDIPYTDGQGNRRTAYADDLPMVIRSVLENDPDPQLLDLKPPLAIPGGTSNTIRSVATGLLVAAALALTILVIQRIPRRQRAIFAPVLAPPAETARRELEAIVADGLLERAQYAVFYRRLAFCIREYLEDRYDLPALSCTSTELAREMARRGTDRWLARVVTGLLDECDTVRWAGYLPADERAKRALDLAFAIIELEARSPVGASQA